MSDKTVKIVECPRDAWQGCLRICRRGFADVKPRQGVARVPSEELWSFLFFGVTNWTK
jgi:hypothetical protein